MRLYVFLKFKMSEEEEENTFESSSETQKFNLDDDDKILNGWKVETANLNKGSEGFEGSEEEHKSAKKEKSKRKRAPPKCSVCIKNGKTEEEAEGHNSRTCPLNPDAKTKKSKDDSQKINTNIVIPILQQELKDLRTEVESLKKILNATAEKVGEVEDEIQQPSSISKKLEISF